MVGQCRDDPHGTATVITLGHINGEHSGQECCPVQTAGALLWQDESCGSPALATPRRALHMFPATAGIAQIFRRRGDLLVVEAEHLRRPALTILAATLCFGASDGVRRQFVAIAAPVDLSPLLPAWVATANPAQIVQPR